MADTNLTCKICGHDCFFLLKKDRWLLFQCSHCNVVFVDPPPHIDYLKEEVYSEKAKYQIKKISSQLKAKPTERFERFLKFIEKDGAGRKILDVGCSSGEFMYFANQRGYQMWGVELNKKTASIAQADGLNVFLGTLSEAKYENNFFDYILLGDVIEHVPDPRELIAECVRILSNNGKIIIATPNIGCFWSRATLILYRLFKIPWSSIDPPGHLFYFSEANLNLLMKQFSFLPVKVRYDKKSDLRNELGHTHLWGRFKRDRSIKNALFFVFGFGVYTLLYVIDSAISPFKRQTFVMTAIYRRV